MNVLKGWKAKPVEFDVRFLGFSLNAYPDCQGRPGCAPDEVISGTLRPEVNESSARIQQESDDRAQTVALLGCALESDFSADKQSLRTIAIRPVRTSSVIP
ncbi:hypothetical protein Pla52n_34730 [Stieleria varia]|uniref:Uncharacterized protein n=1 Tax=Stieleria varia TaxID=2528005 RepID=A0A5C6AQV5_9BACT|nr:hypothetical protein Pla52n_34730 [Stieleria varia]